MGRGLHDAGVTLGGRIGALFATVATQSILAWNLGPEGRGSLVVCLLFVSMLVLIFSVGCNVSGRYFVSSRKFSIPEVLFYLSILGVISSLCAMAAGWGLIHTPLSFFSKATHNAFFLSLLLVPATILSAVFYRLLTAVRLFKHFAAITVLSAVLQLLLTLCFVWWAGWGVQGALLASLFTAATTCVVCVVVYYRNFEMRLVKPSIKNFTAIVSYGIRYYVGRISRMAQGQIGVIVLAFFATRAEIGWFAIAISLTKLVEMVPEALTAALFPRVAADEQGKKYLVARAARVTLAICGGIFLCLALLATPIVRILFSPDFLPAVPLIRILAVGGSVHCMVKVYLSYLVATQHPGKASISAMMGVMANVGLLCWLLPRIGVAAAAWAMTANYLVSSVILFLYFSRLSGMRLREMFSFSRNDWEEFDAIVRKFTRNPT